MIQVPLANNGQADLLSTGIRVPAVAQNVTAGPAVGQGLMHLGALGADMAFQMRKSQDAAGMAKAVDIMDQHAAEQKLYQAQNPDENTWPKAWQDRYATVQDQLSKIPLSDQARATLDQTLNSWHQRQGINVQLDAVGASKNNALTSAITLATKQAQEGNVAGVGKSLALLKGIYPDEVIQARQYDLEQQAKDARKTQGLQNAQTALNQNQPDTAMSWYDKLHAEGVLSQEERNLRVSGVESTKLKDELSSHISLAKTQAQVKDMLALAEEHYKGGHGRLNGPLYADLTKLGKSQMDQLDAQGAEDWMNIINGGVDKNQAMKELESEGRIYEPTRKKLAQIIQRGVVADPIAYARVYQDANSFDGQEGSAEYSQMIKRINLELPNGPEKDSAMAALKGAVGKKQDALTRSINSMYSQAVDGLENGEFGEYRASLDTPSAVLPKNIRDSVDVIKSNLMWSDKVSPEDQAKPEIARKYEMMAREKWWENLPKKEKGDKFSAYIIDDEVKKAAAYRRYQEAMASSEQFRQQNPKHTLEDVRAVLNGYMVKQKAASMSGQLGLPQATGNEQPTNLLPSIDSMRKLYAPNPGK